MQNFEFFLRKLILQNVCKIILRFEFGALQKYANLVDLEKCYKFGRSLKNAVTFWLQKSASIQLGTGHDKFAVGLASPELGSLSDPAAAAI